MKYFVFILFVLVGNYHIWNIESHDLKHLGFLILMITVAVSADIGLVRRENKKP